MVNFIEIKVNWFKINIKLKKLFSELVILRIKFGDIIFFDF